MHLDRTEAAQFNCTWPGKPNTKWFFRINIPYDLLTKKLQHRKGLKEKKKTFLRTIFLHGIYVNIFSPFWWLMYLALHLYASTIQLLAVIPTVASSLSEAVF